VRGIPNAERSRHRPLVDAVDLNGQQLHIVKVADRCRDVSESGRDASDRAPERGNAIGLQLGKGALAYEEPALKIVGSGDSDECTPVADLGKRVAHSPGGSWHSKPQHVDRNPVVGRYDPQRIPHGRGSTVRCDGKVRIDLQRSAGRGSAHANNSPVLADHVVRCRLHHKTKGRLLLCLSHEHAQQIPLRHQRDIAMRCWKRSEVDRKHSDAVYYGVKRGQFTVVDCACLTAQPQLVKEVES
jgi:hypothetical protein